MPVARLFRVNLLLSRCLALLAPLALCASAAMAGNVVYTVEPASGRVTRATFPDGSYIDYAYDGNGNRTTATVVYAADTQAPTVPVGLVANAISGTRIDLSWGESTDNRPNPTYKLERCQGTGCSSFSQIATPTTTSYSDTTLSAGNSYSYRVRAVDAASNHSGYSNTATAVTLDSTPPSAPGTPTFGSITSTSAVAAWTAATDNVGVTGYQWQLNGGAWTSGTSPLTLTSLTSNTTYSFGVRARDAAGNWGNASSATFTTSDVTPPSPPGTPTFGSITSTSAVASWTAATDNVGVTGYEWQLNNGAWTSGTSPLSLTSLTSSTTYSFAVRARDAAGNWGNASSASFTTTDVTPPSAPGTPTFSNIGQTTATVSWTAATDNVGVTGYQYSVNGGAWTTGTSPVGLTGLTASTTYTVQVRARDAAGNWGSASSASFTTQTAADTTPPGAPGTPGFSSITGSSATASWSAATDNVGVTAYEYSLNGGAWTSNALGLSLGLTGLTNATTYTLQVRARDGAGNIGAVSSNSFATPDTAAPSTPGTPGFSSITGSSATASWSSSSDNVAVTAYEYSLNGGAWTSNSTSTSVGLTGLTNGSSYSLQVRARDAAGNYSGVSSNSFTTLDTAAPSTPGTPGFSSITGSSATASWTASSDNVAVTGYEYSLSGGAWTSTGISTSVSLTGLTNGTGYSVQVRARDAAANYSGVSSNSFTTLDTAAPSAPGTPGFSSITGSSATATWSAASDNVGVVEYQYSLSGGGWTSTGSATSVGLTGLANGTGYSFQVRARDAANNWSSASSNSFSTLDTAAPSTPGTPSFNSIGASSATANWGESTDNVGVTGYEYSLNGGAWTSNSTSTSVNLTGLSVATTYTVAVRARDAAANYSSSSSNSFATVDNVAPSAPGTPSVSNVASATATATWTAASDNVGVTSYEYSVNGGSSWTNVGNVLSTGVTGLSGATAYTVQVRARDAAGNVSGVSTSDSFTTLASLIMNSTTVSNTMTGNFALSLLVLTNNGQILVSQPGTTNTQFSGNWLSPVSGMGNFDVRATLTSTACSSGTAMGTWSNLGSAGVNWQMQATGHTTRSCSFTLDFRATSNPSVILRTVSVTLTAINP